MACPNCVKLTKSQGVLTRCPEHPLKSGLFQHPAQPLRSALVEKTVQGRTVLTLEQFDLSKPDPENPVLVNTEFPARPLRGNPSRIPFLQGTELLSRRGTVTLKHESRGWEPLTRRQFGPPQWWAEEAMKARKK